ncbi:MAG: glutamate racemase [Candidatus Nitrosotenuis sp.]
MIIGSNTPSLLFPDLFLDNDRLIGVLPPLLLASKKTKTNSIAVLGTTATIKSHELDSYIHNNISKKCSVCKIDATELIDLVESAEFIHNKQYCIKIIKNKLSKLFEQRNVDVVTLSSTHLPFLLKIFHKVFPQILFLDPAMDVANQLIRNNFFKESTRSSLQIFSSKNPLKLQKNLEKMQVNKSVKFFEC